jgi:hypothetical protein
VNAPQCYVRRTFLFLFFSPTAISSRKV